MGFLLPSCTPPRCPEGYTTRARSKRQTHADTTSIHIPVPHASERPGIIRYPTSPMDEYIWCVCDPLFPFCYASRYASQHVFTLLLSFQTTGGALRVGPAVWERDNSGNGKFECTARNYTAVPRYFRYPCVSASHRSRTVHNAPWSRAFRVALAFLPPCSQPTASVQLATPSIEPAPPRSV